MGLGLADPAAQRLLVDAQVLRDMSDRTARGLASQTARPRSSSGHFRGACIEPVFSHLPRRSRLVSGQLQNPVQLTCATSRIPAWPGTLPPRPIYRRRSGHAVHHPAPHRRPKQDWRPDRTQPRQGSQRKRQRTPTQRCSHLFAPATGTPPCRRLSPARHDLNPPDPSQPHRSRRVRRRPAALSPPLRHVRLCGKFCRGQRDDTGSGDGAHSLLSRALSVAVILNRTQTIASKGPSPRARGADDVRQPRRARAGTIPAGAGSRDRSRHGASGIRDHPRGRGEQAL